MFDIETRSLITSAPVLPELDRDRLPEEFTSAFVEITATRLMVSGITENENDRTILTDRLQRIRRLANTYSAYVALGLAEDRTASSAFVAGTGFRLLGEASTVNLDIPAPENDLDHDSVSDWLLAIVLFLIAGYPADALATTNAMDISAEPPSNQGARSVWGALRALGRGQLSSVMSITQSVNPTSLFESNRGVSADELAVELMWGHLAQGLSLLSLQLLGLWPGEPSPNQTPRRMFQRVVDLAHSSYEVLLPSTLLSQNVTRKETTSIFAGPHLLASLLIKLCDRIEPRAVINTPTPPVVDDGRWKEVLSNVALERPFLWENHLDAIHQGYLENGTSAVLSFPTGAGKSTLAELKIASHLLSGNKVIYVAPTHALANQVRRTITKTFPDFEVHDSLIGDGYYSEVGDEGSLSDVTVMTPERCLMLLELYPRAFSQVGLFILDECHLLHPSSGVDDRRALDTMLCLLRVTEEAQSTDVLLLSAMMAKAVELAGWLESMLQRRCIALNLAWKPTRQARGCLVYPSTELERLRKLVLTTRSQAKPGAKGPSVALKRQLTATPIGLFCLKQSWITSENEDYRACSLSNSEMPIDIDDRWSLSTGKNDVAAKLASSFAKQNIKTIVFSQNKKHCESIANKVEKELGQTRSAVHLTAEEEKLAEAAVEEVGVRQHTYLPLSKGVACHHRLLTPIERRLAEQLFGRGAGANVIVATPTLAQGVNLPAQAVILAGEHRFDRQHETTAIVEAHELLNAAGRAGRAGFHPEGVVILIPDRPIGFDSTKYEIGQAWFTLKDTIFAKGDNCLTINDPIELLLDQLQNAENLAPGILTYFVNRLPVDANGDTPTFAATERLLNRSFAAYRALRNGTQRNFQQRLALAVSYRQRSLQNTSKVDWSDRLAAANGISAQTLTAISTELDKILDPSNMDVLDWSNWLIGVLSLDVQLADELVRRESVRGVLGKTFVPTRPTPWRREPLEHIKKLIELWLKGMTLVEIENAIAGLTNKTARQYCTRARELSQTVTLDLSFALGLLPQVWKASRGDDVIPINMAVASACMRRGLYSPAHLALSMIMRTISGEQSTRPQTNLLFRRIDGYLRKGLPNETFVDTRKRVDSALLEFEVLSLLNRRGDTEQ